MKINEKIKKEIEQLIIDGRKLYKFSIHKFISEENEKELNPEEVKKINEELKTFNFLKEYQIWYTKSLELLNIFLPSRKDDFIEYFKRKNDDKRTKITLINYCINDALNGLKSRFVSTESAAIMIGNQVNIVESILPTYESVIKTITFDIQSQLLDDEIESAKKLLKINIRASGSLAGVVLERHLKLVCKEHNINIKKKNPTINDFNEALKANSIIEIQVFRHIQMLGDIRNKCDHPKEKDPTKDDVEELIRGTEKIIKTVY